MITRLLDLWWDAQTTRARRRRRVDVWDTDAPGCTCGHLADVHRHYRDGHDCSQCDCRTYRPERITP